MESINVSNIIDAFRDAISDSNDIRKAVYGDNPVPEQIEDTILALSSINFADLLIDVENRLGVDFAEEFMTMSKISIGDLARMIESHV